MNLNNLTTASSTLTVTWNGGRGAIKANATPDTGSWGSGTLTVTWCETNDGVFVPIGSGLTFTEDGLEGFEAPAGYLNYALTGSTDASIEVGVDTTCYIVTRV